MRALSILCLTALLSSLPARALIGGRESRTEDFPTMIHYRVPGTPAANCGAVKVGRFHYLTAAHCVTKAVGATLEEDFQPGRQIEALLNRADAPREARRLTIVNVAVHPRWTQIAPKHWRPVNASRDPKAADLAIIVVKEETASPIQTISFATPWIGQEVILTGSGKEEISNPDEVLARRFKTTNKLIKDLTANSLGVTAEDPGFNTISLPYPGDSGSPVYTRAADGSLDLVGIMSWVYPYPTASDARGLPLGLKPDSPAHAARVDASPDIRSWILEVTRSSAKNTIE